MNYVGYFRVSVLTRALAALAITAGCKSQQSGGVAVQAQSSPPSIAVQTTRPERRDVSRLISVPADVVPIKETTLYSKVPGYLDQILVDKGDRVSAGQLLAVIRAPELEAERLQAEQAYRSAVESSNVSLATGRRTAEEQRKSRATEQKVRADYIQAPASVSKARAQLAQANSALGRAREGKAVADAMVDDSRAQLEKAAADLQAAESDQRLADITYERYSGIYAKDNKLIARQQVDEAEAKANAARSKAQAARSQLESARVRIRSAQASARGAQEQIVESQAGVEAAKEQVAISEAQMQSSAKQVEMANRDVEISRKQQDIVSAQSRQTRLQADAMRSSSRKFAAMADYARLRAPFAGIVIKRQVDPGAFIQTASSSQNAQPILNVANIDRLRVYVHVPESESRYVRPGTPVKLSVLSMPDETIKATVTRISSSLDARSPTMHAEVDLSNRDQRLLPGLYAIAKIALENHPKVIAIPKEGVGVEKTGKFVFVVDNVKAKRVPITTGFDDGAWVEITDGLKGDEEVVVTGRDNLTPNSAVSTTQWVPKKKTKSP